MRVTPVASLMNKFAKDNFYSVAVTAFDIEQIFENRKKEIRELATLLKAFYPSVEVDEELARVDYIPAVPGMKTLLELVPILHVYSPSIVVKTHTIVSFSTEPQFRVSLLAKRFEQANIVPQISFHVEYVPVIGLLVELSDEQYRRLLSLLPEKYRRYFKPRGIRRGFYIRWEATSWPPKNILEAKYCYNTSPYMSYIEYPYFRTIPREAHQALIEAAEKLLGDKVSLIKVIAETFANKLRAEEQKMYSLWNTFVEQFKKLLTRSQS